MDRIINVSDRSNAAIHALALAAAAEGRVTAASAAAALGVSPSYLAKTLQALSRAGLVVAERGAAGGFSLAREAASISCLEVLVLVDGELPSKDCLFKEAVCPRKGCAIRVMCEKAERAFRACLETTSIAAIAASFKRSAKG